MVLLDYILVCLTDSMTMTLNMTDETHQDGDLVISKTGYKFYASTLQGLFEVERKLEETPNPEHSLTLVMLIEKALEEVRAKQDEIEG